MNAQSAFRLTDYANCAGCAGKLPVEMTAQVIGSLPPQVHPDLLAGAENFEDAGVFRVAPDTAIVQTVDFFPPLVDDPYTFGQIAATNAISDVYAMGGRPITALNLVCFPDKEVSPSVLNDILRGGAERVAAAGAVILGGHSLRDTEVKYGLAVTGLIHPDRIVRNSGARPGDVLVLTKPLGSGVLASAAKSGKIAPGEIAEAVAVMTTLNKDACEAMVDVGIHGATDVTGFGLIGHAWEMAEAAGVTIAIEAKAVPLMSRVMELAGRGVLTRAHASCKAHVGERLIVRGVSDVLVNILADAQTSGGLLISVAADRADRLVADLKRRRTPAAAMIGRVEPGPAKISVF